jgi:FkbM family methyltransferase
MALSGGDELKLVHWMKSALRPRARLDLFRTYYRRNPPLCRETFRYALRRTLLPEIRIPMWITTLKGTRLFLGKDIIDDHILVDLMDRPQLFFPPLPDTENNDGIVLDVGGHHGLFACEAMAHYPMRRFLIVEPHPGWCKIIQKNIDQNRLNNRCRIAATALGDKTGSRTLFYENSASWGATIEKTDQAEQSIEVNSMTLSDILQGEQPVLVYCNAEGAEYQLVPQLLARNVQPAVLVIMMHPEYGDPLKLRKALKGAGYIEDEMCGDPLRPAYHYRRQGCAR